MIDITIIYLLIILNHYHQTTNQNHLIQEDYVHLEMVEYLFWLVVVILQGLQVF